jgi:HK97 family phage prohead protease
MNDYEPGVRYVVRADGAFVKYKSIRESTTQRSNKGFIIQGIATKYSSVLQTQSGRFVYIMPDAFKVSMRYDKIEVWLDHQKSLSLKDCRVELFSDEESLNFRVHLLDSEICHHARALVECDSYSQCSVGFHSSVVSKRDVVGTEVSYVLRGTLTDVSLLSAGGCASTHCEVSRLADCNTLEDDCKRFRMKSDNDFIAIRRAFQKLESET